MGPVGERRFGASRRLFAAVLVLVVVLGGMSPLPIAAQGGERIVSIEWKGLSQLSEETLAYYLELEEGGELDLEALDEEIHDLWERQLIEDIVVETEDVPGGVELIITVKERPILRSIEYKGLKKLGQTDIQERLDRERVRMREGMPLSRGELERIQSILMEMYREKGYRFAQVDYTIEEVSPGDRRVRFTVDEGDKVKIQDVEFEGNTVFTDYRLKWALRKTRPSGPISRLLRRDVYNPASFQEDLDRVRDLYREQGYKNVTILEPRIEVRALRPNAPTPKKQKRRLFITVPIEEEERWRFGEITINGNEVFSDEALLRAFDRPRGPWLRSSAVDDGIEAIDETYRNSGYIYSQVDVTLEEREGSDNVADVVVNIHEGDQYRVGRLEFEGNTRTRDKVLRREFRVQEGMVLNMGGVRNSLFKLNQLGYFTLDENNPIEFQNFDNEGKTVDLLVHGEEADRTELLFGGGWSELDGFFGQFSVRTQNFLGRGETLSLALQTGRVRDLFEFSYFIPWFRDRPQSMGLQVFDRSLDFVLLGTQRQLREETGGVVSYGRAYGLFNSVRLSYGYTDLEDTVEFFDAEGELQTQSAQFKKSNLRPMWIYDSRDHRLEPTTGQRATASVEYAGGFLGGNIDLWRPELSWTYYRPVSSNFLTTVVGLNVEGGWVEPFDGTELPLLERYYLGGSRSVRGFATRSIFLRDKDGNPITDQIGNVVGGTEFVELGLEYHVLLGGPFRLVFFADAGNVFDGDLGQGFSVDDLRYTAGAELRLFVPVFGLPLRFIYAENLDPKPNDRFESFQFDIGTSF